MGIINYIKTVWADRSVQYPTKYTATKAGGGTISSGDDITLTPSAGTITNAGTQVTASRMNNLEDAVEVLDLAVGSTWINLGTTELDGTDLIIPTGYKCIRVILEGINITSSTTQSIYFNSDSTTNYSYYFTGEGTGKSSSSNTIITGNFGNGNVYHAIIEFVNSTDKPKLVTFNVHDQSGIAFFGTGMYKISTEITSMEMTFFSSGRATIYGIK